jgi:hypothetical protein
VQRPERRAAHDRVFCFDGALAQILRDGDNCIYRRIDLLDRAQMRVDNLDRRSLAPPNQRDEFDSGFLYEFVRQLQSPARFAPEEQNVYSKRIVNPSLPKRNVERR